MKSMKFHTAREAGDLLSLSHNSLRVYARKYRVGEKRGRDWFFSDADLELIRFRMGKIGRPKKEKKERI